VAIIKSNTTAGSSNNGRRRVGLFEHGIAHADAIELMKNLGAKLDADTRPPIGVAR
jgi:hypothetical protein